MPVRIKLIDRDVVLMQFLSEKEVLEVLQCINGPVTPFLAVDRWMEVIGCPPHPSWVKFLGVPLHAWREEVLHLLGNCVGATIEVDECTISKEILTHGRVRVLLGKVKKLPIQIPLWVGDL